MARIPYISTCGRDHWGLRSFQRRAHGLHGKIALARIPYIRRDTRPLCPLKQLVWGTGVCEKQPSEEISSTLMNPPAPPISMLLGLKRSWLAKMAVFFADRRTRPRTRQQH